MEFAEFRIIFNRPIILDDALFSKFEERSKELGYTNTIVNEGIRACFDSKGGQTTLNNQNFVLLVGKLNEEDLNKIGNNVLYLLDKLIQLDKNAKASIRFVDLENQPYDTFSKSRDCVKSIVEDAIGVGYRYFFKTDDGISDFKAEPFIHNNDMWYFEATFNHVEFSDISKTTDFIENSYDKFKGNKRKFIDMIERE